MDAKDNVSSVAILNNLNAVSRIHTPSLNVHDVIGYGLSERLLRAATMSTADRETQAAAVGIPIQGARSGN